MDRGNRIMAYFYGTPRNPETNVSYDLYYMCESIKDFLQGSDWRTDGVATGSQGFNGSAGNYAGTNATSGMYYNISAGYSSPTHGHVTFYKKHYATGQTSGWTPSYKIVINVDSSDGWRVNVYDDNGSNSTPTSNVSVGMGGTTAAAYNRVGGGYGSNVHEMHIIANDTTFMMKVSGHDAAGGGTASTRDHGWFVLNDLEYAPTIDNWAYGIDDTYCPSVLVHSAWMNVMDNPIPSKATSNYAHFGVGQPRYIDHNGVVRTAEFNAYNGSFQFGLDVTANRQYSTISPPPALNQEHFNVSGGDAPIHQLTPVQFIGQHSLRLAASAATATAINKNPRRGRMMNMYRISDNAGNDGDVILEGSTRYRIFKPHKCGYQFGYEGDVNACYAFPEANVPYV